MRAEGGFATWWFRSEVSPLLRARVLPARAADSKRLGIADTIGGYIAGDLTYPAWEHWFTGLARAARLEDDEAARLIADRANVYIGIVAFDSHAREPLRLLVAELARLGNGIVWTGQHSWSCRSLVAPSADLDAALWGDAA